MLCNADQLTSSITFCSSRERGCNGWQHGIAELEQIIKHVINLHQLTRTININMSAWSGSWHVLCWLSKQQNFLKYTWFGHQWTHPNERNAWSLFKRNGHKIRWPKRFTLDPLKKNLGHRGVAIIRNTILGFFFYVLAVLIWHHLPNNWNPWYHQCHNW